MSFWLLGISYRKCLVKNQEKLKHNKGIINSITSDAATAWANRANLIFIDLV